MFGMIPYGRAMTRHDMWNANDIFRSFFESAPASFRVDVRDEGDRYVMEAELPGIRKEDVKVSVENGVLTISAVTDAENERKAGNYVCRERRVGSMQRAFSLEGVREDGITGEYRDGILRLSLPRLTEALPARREIEIA